MLTRVVTFFSVGVFTLACLAGVGRAAEAPKKESGQQKWAVLVGVDDYANAGKLRYCGADQRALRDRLLAAGFPGDQVVLLEDGAKESRYRPSRLNIKRQIEQVLGFAEENDVVVLGFSGHGTQIGRQSYLVPNDGDPGDASSLVPLDEVYDQLQACAASVKLVFVDACRNDTVPGGRRSADPSEGARALARSLQDARLPEGVVLFNSCAPGEISWEDESFGHGVFMHYVLEGLDGDAETSGDGAVSINELRTYTALRTKKHVAKQFNGSQRPFLRADADGELLDFALLPVTGGRAGQVVENSIGMKLVRIKAGQFEMGSNESKEERPVHLVRITKPFLMGQTEVTQAQFERVMRSTPWRGNVYVKDGPEVAASYVSWDDAADFCRKLTEAERQAGKLPAGRSYRLPTEAEWEYACRAGTKTEYSFGDDEGLLGDHAWWGGIIGDGNAKTELYAHEVGRKKPNPWTLHDMHGNVYEWCSDWYDEDYYARSPEVDPKGPDFAGSFRVVRGGSWYGFPVYCRSAFRDFVTPASRFYFIGFRVVCELE